jgi:hypothetical protein
VTYSPNHVAPGGRSVWLPDGRSELGQSPEEPGQSAASDEPDTSSANEDTAEDAALGSALARAGLRPTQDSDGPVGPARHAWLAFREWRRSRPFWAGLLLVIAGAELLLIPLPMHSMGLIMHIGIGGVSGILIGAVLIVCGLLLWFNPAQRIFYSIVAVLLAIAALVATNLGGFLIGTVLGVIGGSLGFAWMPGRPAARDRSRARWPHRAPGGSRGSRARTRSAGAESGSSPAESPPAESRSTRAKWPRRPPMITRVSGAGLALAQGSHRHAEDSADRDSGRTSPDAGKSGSATFRTMSVVPVAVLLLLGLLHQPLTALDHVLGGSPSASASPDPKGKHKHHHHHHAHPTPSPSPTSSPSPSPSRSVPARSPLAAGPIGKAAAVPSVLTANSVKMTGLVYDGVADVPTANGTVKMMKFSASTLNLSGDDKLTVRQNGGTMLVQAADLDFSGHVTLYTTELSGDLFGVPVVLTPDSPLSLILQVVGPVTKKTPLTMTDVVSHQPYTTADSLQVSGLQLSGS